MLVVNKPRETIAEFEYGSVEKIIVDNSIPVTKSFKNSTGYLVLFCENSDSRDKLKDIISEKDENLRMKSIVKKKLTITSGIERVPQERRNTQSTCITKSVYQAFFNSK